MEDLPEDSSGKKLVTEIHEERITSHSSAPMANGPFSASLVPSWTPLDEIYHTNPRSPSILSILPTSDPKRSSISKVV